MGLNATDASTLQVVSLSLRGGTVLLLLLVAALLMRDHSRHAAARLGAVLAVGTAAYAVCSAPEVASRQTWWHAPLIALAAGNAVVFWLFARALFDDAFRLRPWHGALWAAFVAVALVEFFVLRPAGLAAAGFVVLAHGAGRVALAVLAVGYTLSSWRADLVEERRRLRVFIVGATALYIAVEAAFDLAFQPVPRPAFASTANAAGLAAMALIITSSLLRVTTAGLFPAAAEAGETAVVGGALRSGRDGILRPADDKVVGALRRLMTIERVYRQEGLTIGALALKLGLPEYRTRRLINQSLGFRNFNAFLNHYRVAEAKAALADSAQVEVPVLTIALDAGFQSLGPFNRAFKAETGLTPSDYRRRHVRAPNAKPFSEEMSFEISKSA